ncbi:MAG: ribonuclease [Bacteroidia bacterium]|nr:MAG: ribonuclease [Bacteroidia bacterium]
MSFELTILGSGSARPIAERCPSAHALLHGRWLYLVDCGEGTQLQLARYGLPLERISAIFLTHLHADHVLGVFGLLATLSMTNRTAPLRIFAHPAFEPLLRMNLDFFVERPSFSVDFRPFSDDPYETLLDEGNMTVRTVPLRHRIPTRGFIFEEKRLPPNIRRDAVREHGLSPEQVRALKDGEPQRLACGRILRPGEVLYQKQQPASYAYLSDTSFSPELATHLQGVDCLYHEATFMNELEDTALATGHSTAGQAGQMARLAGTKRLIVGHFSARYRDLAPLLRQVQEVFPHAVPAREGETHSI